MSLVLDASAAVDVTLGAPYLVAPMLGEDLHVPVHFDVEVTSSLRGLVLRGQVSAPEAERARERLGRFDLVRHPVTHLLDRAWELRHRFAIQDGVYVGLAEGLGCPLLSTDHRLARAVDDLVEVVVPHR